MRQATLLLAMAALAASVPAQAGFAYPSPPSSQFQAVRNVPFGQVAGTKLNMDVFRPADSRPAPAIIFSYLAVGAEKAAFGNGIYRGWAEYAASQGLVAILADLRMDHADDDTNALLDHVIANAASYGVDPQRIAMYGASANALRVLPFVQNPAEKRIKAAVIYYGSANVPRFRLDLPVLVVRAGLDRPALNRNIADLSAAAIAQNAPVTVINHPSGYHGFEDLNDDDATRQVIDQTIAFVKSATAPRFQAAIASGVPQASAAGYVMTGDFAAAARQYADLVARDPNTHTLRLAYGEALLGAKQYGAACAEFEKLRDKPLGARDRGVPAARACALSGAADTAIGWINSIPAQFRPPELRNDPAFAAIRDRADFKGLFEPAD